MQRGDGRHREHRPRLIIQRCVGVIKPPRSLQMLLRVRNGALELLHTVGGIKRRVIFRERVNPGADMQKAAVDIRQQPNLLPRCKVALFRALPHLLLALRLPPLAFRAVPARPAALFHPFPDTLHCFRLLKHLPVGLPQRLLRQLLLPAEPPLLAARPAPDLGNRDVKLRFMLQELFHSFNLLRKQVKPLFERNIDIGAALLHFDPQPPQPVIQLYVGGCNQHKHAPNGRKLYREPHSKPSL